jgi:putative spermidine/putrescine transport system substrate-binding protein
VLGTHVTLQEELRQKAMEDLGIEFEAKGSTSVLQKASMYFGARTQYKPLKPSA